jgi:hypothetical protein
MCVPSGCQSRVIPLPRVLTALSFCAPLFSFLKNPGAERTGGLWEVLIRLQNCYYFNRHVLLSAMEGHVLAQGELVATLQQPE